MDIPSYSRPAIYLHWLMAPLILVALALGLYMTGLELSPGKLRLYAWHKWLGVSLCLLALGRLAWRLGHRPPAPLPLPAWQARAAALTHGALYLLLLAIPLSGWLMSSAKGFQTVYFGVLPIPDLIGRDPALAEGLASLHATLNWLLLVLLAIHLAAALKHHYLDRDATLVRMAPWLKTRR